MAIKRDLSQLPKAKAERKQGWAPDPEPTYGKLLVDAWHDKQEPRPLADPDARFRHSDAAACSRLVAYAALDIEPTNPMDRAGSFVAEQGHLIHEAWQNVLLQRFGPYVAQVEVEVVEGEMAGHIDAVVVVQVPGKNLLPPKIVSIEVKSVGGYAYQLAVGARGAPEGPRHTAVVQGALNARAVNADEMRVIYFSREAISVQTARRKRMPELLRVCSEWTLTRDQYEPIADAEIARVGAILELVDDGMLPRRHIPDPQLPDNHLIVDPREGSWVEQDAAGAVVDTGSAWQCVYCRYQDLCDGHPGTMVAIDEVGLRSKEEDNGPRT